MFWEVVGVVPLLERTMFLGEGGRRIRRGGELGMLCFSFRIMFYFMFWVWERSKMLGGSFENILFSCHLLQRIEIAIVLCHLFVEHFLSPDG
jgi:hypothetical protein